jgi:hypothetical protein
MIDDIFRPRDEHDVDVHPESVRGEALVLMDLIEGTKALVARHVASMPWYKRWPTRAALRAAELWVRFLFVIRRA